MKQTSMSMDLPSGSSQTCPAQNRELMLRIWIANRESVCPYAPGVARYVHLPESFDTEREWATHLGSILKEFYAARVDGKRLERLILLPPTDWLSHEEALSYSRKAFWRISAGYYMQSMNGRKFALKALEESLDGIATCSEQGIRNPIIGRLSDQGKAIPHFKSMFLSAFSPVYANQGFFRYAPASALVLVNSKALFEKRRKHPKVITQIDEDMLFGNLLEATKGQIELEKKELVAESKVWETVLFNLYRSETPNWMSLAEPEISTTVGSLNTFNLNEAFSRLQFRLPVMTRICRSFGVSPCSVLKASYLHAGLYVAPFYLS